VQVKRALISVSDKTGLEMFVKGLDSLGVEIISTGGTAKLIASWGIAVVEISSYTGYPEMLDGRVKTLHPKIHAGILALRDNKDHARQIKEKNIPYIDMVVVNLYPFEETVSREGVSIEEAIENIDIGGPSMLRSAAKNFKSVAVVSSPDQYVDILAELKEKGECSQKTLKSLAVKVFERTSGYDRAISAYLSEHLLGERNDEKISDEINISLRKVYELRYGENPHQKAAFYKDSESLVPGVADARKIQGKQLSFNNIIDISSAMEMVMEFEEPAVSIVKHNNPCGIATAATLCKAYIDALDCDRLSAFGSIMAFNAPIDGECADLIIKESNFVECIIAPGYDEKALEIFKSKKNLRVMELSMAKNISRQEKDIKKVAGGVLVQDIDRGDVLPEDLKIPTRVKPHDELMKSLLFAWKVVKHVKSNAIVLSKGTRTVGIGAGQMSRVDSVLIAVKKAGKNAEGAVLASDAFFPMPDSIEEAHKAGVSAIIQPGGSIRDEEVIAACDKFGIPMVLTGMRHFRH